MNKQWFDETLIAIGTRGNGKHYVIELPARQIHSQTGRFSFTDRDQAEEHIKDQYKDIIIVQLEDIDTEIEYRKEIIAQQQQIEEYDTSYDVPYPVKNIVGNICISCEKTWRRCHCSVEGVESSPWDDLHMDMARQGF